MGVDCNDFSPFSFEEVAQHMHSKHSGRSTAMCPRGTGHDTGNSSGDTLARRVSGLIGRYTALSAERRTQATCYKAEASYLYGAAAAFEVVATELWEALGKHGAVARVARVPHLSVLADHLTDGSPTDGLGVKDSAEATVEELLHDGATT